MVKFSTFQSVMSFDRRTDRGRTPLKVQSFNLYFISRLLVTGSPGTLNLALTYGAAAIFAAFTALAAAAGPSLLLILVDVGASSYW